MFHIGDVIRKVRMGKELTIEEVVEKAAPMSKTTVSELERGEGNPTLDTMERVASALGTSVMDLYVLLARDIGATQNAATSGTPGLTAEEQEWLALWRALPEKSQPAGLIAVRHLVEVATQAAGQSPRTAEPPAETPDSASQTDRGKKRA